MGSGATLNPISAGLSSRVFLELAPPGANYPFIVYQCQSPPRDVRGVGTFRVMVDTLYVVKAIAQVASYEPLVPVAKAIDTIMTAPVGGSVADGNVWVSIRENQFSMTEDTAGSTYRHLGGVYRIQAQA